MADAKEKLVKVTAAKTFQCMGEGRVVMVKAGEEISISATEAEAALKAGVLVAAKADK